MLIDLHAYTTPGGGRPLRDVVEDSRRLGLDAVVVADRHASAATAGEVLAAGEDAYPVMVAVELETSSGDVLLVVPKLDPFYTREEWRQLTSLGKPALKDVVALAEQEGGVVLLAHAYDRNRPGAPRDRVFTLDGLSGAEVATGASEPIANQMAVEALAAAHLPVFAGTATKSRPRGETTWATLFGRPVTGQADLVDALRAGEFWAVEVLPQGAKPVPRPPRPEGGRFDGPRPPRPDGPRDGGGRGRDGGGGGRDGARRDGGRREGGPRR